MTRAGVGLALLISLYAALLFADLVGQAVNNFRRNTAQTYGLAASDDVETAARAGDGTGGGIFVRAHKKSLLPVLNAGSERSL